MPAGLGLRMRIVGGYLLFVWALLVPFTSPAVETLSEQVLAHLGAWSIFVLMPLLGLLWLFPILGGPIAFSCWGHSLQRFRIFLAHELLVASFLAGWISDFERGQWQMLVLLFAGQFIATGMQLPASRDPQWAVVGIVGLLVIVNELPCLFIQNCTRNVPWFVIALIGSVYFALSGPIILRGRWRTEPAGFP